MYNQEGLEALELFNTKAEILKKSSFVKFLREQRTGIIISWEKDKPVAIEPRWPDVEALRAFALTFRFFIQKKETSSIRNVARIYDDLPISQEKKDLFKNARKNLNQFLDSDSPAKIDHQAVTRREILRVFMYGELAHADRSKKEMLDLWLSYPLFDAVVFTEFIYILWVFVTFIQWVSSLNKEVLEELGKR